MNDGTSARSTYREVAVRGASPVQLVVALYEQVLHDLRRALAALERRDIEARTAAINHTLVVIGQLQGSLDMENGGEVAENLQRFYDMVRHGVMAAHVAQSAEILKQQIAHVTLVHDAWAEMARAGAPQREGVSPEKAPAAPDVSAPSFSSLAEWDA
jgi:flagellar secretion chaperone FliS